MIDKEAFLKLTPKKGDILIDSDNSLIMTFTGNKMTNSNAPYGTTKYEVIIESKKYKIKEQRYIYIGEFRKRSHNMKFIEA